MDLQVHIGEDKPLWMGLLPGPANSGCCLAVLVRYEDAWRHSEKVPEKGLLQKVCSAFSSCAAVGATNA